MAVKARRWASVDWLARVRDLADLRPLRFGQRSTLRQRVGSLTEQQNALAEEHADLQQRIATQDGALLQAEQAQNAAQTALQSAHTALQAQLAQHGADSVAALR